jgi:dihydroxyacetone kinase-like protein
MNRGMQKVVEKLEDAGGDDIGATLKTVGMTLVSSVGGAAGPLYGTLFLQMGGAAGGASTLDTAGWADAVEAGVKGVQMRGKAQAGDKTMLDALLPAVEALRSAQADGAGVAEAASRSAAAAEEGMTATIPLEARKGRASYLGPRSVGHQDPGATSAHLLLRTASEAFASP